MKPLSGKDLVTQVFLLVVNLHFLVSIPPQFVSNHYFISTTMDYIDPVTTQEPTTESQISNTTNTSSAAP